MNATKMFNILILCLISVFCASECAKILGVFPTPLISHQTVFRPVMLELAKRGHDVTVITPNPAFPKDQAPHNLTEIDVHDVSYEYVHKIIEEYGNEKDPSKTLSLLKEVAYTLVAKQVKSPQVQNFLHKNKKVDLIIMESYIQPALIYSHIYNAPVIEFSSLSGILLAFEPFGALSHPFYYPDVVQRKISNLTIVEKLITIYVHYAMRDVFSKKYMTTDNKDIIDVFNSNVPELDVLKKNVHMLFVNIHPIWDFNRPLPPNVVYLGGLHQKPEKELPQDLKSYLDSSKNGVIYISFGTTVKASMFPTEKLKIFTDAVAKLPYDILWKWDNDELPGRPENVRISKWLPQSDLLRHPNVKLFITQGGLQSTDEAITAAVPLIGFPMLADQWFNAELYAKFNIGKHLSLETLTEEQLLDAIKTVIGDKSYRENIVKLRDIINDQPQSPLERAVWWTEHVLRHGGGAHLRASAALVPWTEYYELELVLTVIGALLIVSAITILLLYYIISKIRFYMRSKVKTN